MKRTISILLLVTAVISLFLLVSCTNEQGGGDGTDPAASGKTTNAESSGSSVTANEPVFVSGSVTIKMNEPADPIIASLGEPKDTYEAPSCAFQGNDYYYNYGSFEVSAYEENGERRIYSVVLKDDLVATPEGISIGSSADDAAKAYGESARTDNGNFVVKTDNAVLTIVIKNGAVSSIDYVAVVGEG